MICDKVLSDGATLRIPAHLSIGQFFLESLRYNSYQKGDRVALVNGNTGEEITYSQLLKNTVNIANGLKKFGVKRGDVIGICSENNNEYITVLMGALCCGATVTLFNYIYAKDEFTQLLNISKPKIIFASETALKTNMETLKEAKFIENFIQLQGEPVLEEIIPLSEIKCECNELLYQADANFRSDDTALIFYSSGTTGLPKGVMLTHINILYVIASLEKGYLKGKSENILSILPCYHVFGFVTITVFLTQHKRVVSLVGFNQEHYLNTIQKYKINCLFLVPPIMVFLAKSPLVDKYDLSSLIVILCGAAPLGEQVSSEVMKRFSNVKLIEGYGLTEATLAVLMEKDELNAPKGLFPIPGFMIKIVDISTGEKLGPNQEGELYVKSPSLMKGYVNNEQATREVFDEEGYLKTGDIGYYNEDGRFYVIDRIKEVMKYKGHQVAPATIENVLMQHPGVADCGVVGKPDNEVGDLPTAFVVPKPGVQLTEKEILDFTSTRLSPTARLRGGVIFKDTIPKSASGKILRRILKKMLENKQ